MLVRLIVGVMLPVLVASTGYARKASQFERKSSILISQQAKRIVASMKPQDLTRDDYFLSSLTGILNNKGLQEFQKVEAFYVMLKKIGWFFNGSIRIFPGTDYLETFTGFLGTYLRYQGLLEPIHYDVGGLLNIVNVEYTKNVILASHALLLASILDHESTSKILKNFMNENAIKRSHMPDIFLHYLSLSVGLCRKYEIALQLFQLLNGSQSEEAKEDILCTLGLFYVPSVIERIKDYVIKSIEENLFDNTVYTGLGVLRKRLKEEQFEKFFNELEQNTNDQKVKKELETFRKNKFENWMKTEPKFRSGFIKTWDKYDVALYDDGYLVSYKNFFRDFVSHDGEIE
jgi:hypothetical protein